MGGEKIEVLKGKPPSVLVGNEYTFPIIGIGTKGDGIGKIDGFVIIVPGAPINTMVKAKIRRVFQTFALADVTE